MTKSLHPEIDCSQAHVDDAAAMLAEYGCVLLRNAFPNQNLLSQLHHFATQAYFVRDWQYAHKELEKVMRLGDYKSGTIAITDFDAPASQPFSSVTALLSQSYLAKFLPKILGKTISVPTSTCVLRRQAIGLHTPPVPYHQDQSFYPQFIGFTDGNQYQVINAWIPLIPCGIDAPGLEVYPIKLDYLLEMRVKNQAKGGIYDFIEVAENDIHTMIDVTKLWAPHYKLGDIMIMTNFTLHRTQMSASMNKPRISVEIRSLRADSPITVKTNVLSLNFN